MSDLISRAALIAEYDRVHIGPPGGARKLMEDAPAVNPLPCKIGDTVWAIRSFKGVKHPQKGIVGEMLYTKDMKLHIVVKYVARGEWGKTVFATYEECVAEIERRGRQ